MADTAVNICIPGDKSLSHRALLFSSLLASPSRVTGLLNSADVRATRRCLTQLGTRFDDLNDGSLHVMPAPWHEPDDVLMVDNSGTSIRLLAGLMAAQPFATVLTGDAAIRRRPMGRVINPLQQMGAQLSGRANNTLAPLITLPSPNGLNGITYTSPVASAQVKSAVLLAGLYAGQTVRYKEPVVSRDHTERFFLAIGLDLQHQDSWMVLAPGQIDHLYKHPGVEWLIPGDISSAAFFMVLASLSPGMVMSMPNIGLNPARTGIVSTLQQMGADIQVFNARQVMGEPVGDITINGTGLGGHIHLCDADIPALVDEIPVLMVAAALMDGSLTVTGAEELRAKESDRLAAMGQAFTTLGIAIDMTPDGFSLKGQQGRQLTKPLHPLATYHDHRIVMSLAILNALTDPENAWPLEGPDWVDVSFPRFFEQLSGLQNALV
jgi:3-phosphoshikimate 1-carboxyvinyltransferase